MAIVWPCALDVESYALAGREVKAQRRSCPRCGSMMIFWSGYRHFVRGPRVLRIFVHRAKCKNCNKSHALLPAFVMKRRFDPADVIGLALMRAAAGEGMRHIAASIAVPHSTARGLAAALPSPRPHTCLRLCCGSCGAGRDVSRSGIRSGSRIPRGSRGGLATSAQAIKTCGSRREERSGPNPTAP